MRKFLWAAFLQSTSGTCFYIFNADGEVLKNKKQKWQEIGRN